MATEVRVPSLGESVSEGVIARWLKRTGDHVEVDEIVLELETDKAAMEVRSPAAGQLEVVQPEGATVPVGAVVGRVDETKQGAKPGVAPVAAPAPVVPAAVVAAVPAVPAVVAAPAAPAPAPAAPAVVAAPVAARAPAPPPPAVPARAATGAPVGPSASPLPPSVRRWAREKGIDPATLRGSGPGGRVLPTDLVAPAGGTAPAAARPADPPDVERVPMTSLRKRIAERLVEAQRTAAILSTFNEVDLTAVLGLRKRYKERFREVHGVDLGFMSIFGRAVIQALSEAPRLNAMIDGTDVVYHQRVNLGVAVSTERGLVVPVVKNADLLGMAELERAIGELAGLARDAKLKPDHLAGGTFTISNGGVFGSLLSTPILNPPQTGILGMHKIQERPVVVDGQIVIRPMMYLALSYDHRLIDGKEAVTFLVRVKERLEDPSRLLLEV
jgi:2-oxoglutarate dehydrogenase E2 component (dihydrolipoamide succinyltransferase)